MDLVFNEISFNDKPTNEHQAISILEEFSKTCASLKKEGFNKLRVESNFWNNLFFNGIDINTFLSKIPSKTQSSFLRSFIRKPFIADEFISEADERFTENNYYFDSISVTGLAYAYLLDTLSVSITTNHIWENTEIELTEVSNGTQKNIFVKNASKPEHIEHHKTWIDEKRPVVLTKTEISPDDKKIKLRDDHGKDTLFDFSKRIVNSPYVEAIINSLPFNPTGRNFIKKIYPNGLIEIVLTQTDRGLGIIVQTTGKNLKETEEIGRLLKEEYE